MKYRNFRYPILLGILFFALHLQAQNVGINATGATPDPSAMLDISATNKGLLIPRTDTSSVNAAGTPAKGLLIFQNSDAKFYFYTGSKWATVAGSFTDSDGQTLTFNAANGELVISGGNTIDLSALDTDDQNLALNGNKLSITDGDTVDLSVLNTDEQTLSLDGSKLSISNGDTVDLAALNTDAQTLSITGKNISISNGNTITLPASDTLSLIQDADRDTKVQTEKNTDEDRIRFTLGGTEYFVMIKGKLQVLNTGYSVFIGENAGNSDDNSNNNNIGIGRNALVNNTSGGGNVAVGSNTLLANTTMSDNVAIGENTLTSLSGGQGNTVVGKGGLYTNTSGSYNTAIGLYSGYYNNGSSNIFIGNRAGQNYNGSDKLFIENTASSTPLIYGDFANDSVKIFGTFKIRNAYSFPNTDGTNGQVLTTNGAGAASWTSPAADTDDQTLTMDNSNAELTISDGNTVELKTISDADADTKIQTEESTDEDKIRFDVAGTEAMIISNNGDVGIGITAPLANLDVKGDANGTADNSLLLRSGNNNNETISNQILFSWDNGTNYKHALKTRHQSASDAGNAIDFYLWDYGTDAAATTGTKRVLTLDGNDKGMIGIGTSSPKSEVHISDGSTSSKAVTDGSGYGASMLITDNNIPRVYFEAAAQTAGKKLMDISVINQTLRISSLNDAGSSFDKEGILSAHRDGRVGINTINPLDALHIIGSMRMVDGNQGAGKIMVSDANGTGSWSNVSSVFADDQTLTMNNTTATLSIVDGNSVLLSTLADTDADTKIQVEESANENKIRFDLAGTEAYRFESGRIQFASSNVYMGDLSGNANTTGTNNVGIGRNALALNTSGYSNTSVGSSALNKNTSGFRNTSIGSNTLAQNLTGNNNTAVGYNALGNSLGDDNTAYGQESLLGTTSGTGNVGIGKSTLYSNTTGSNNTALGLYAGYFNTGSANVFLGHRAGQNETGSNKLYIENSASTTPLIYGDFANDSVKIFGTLRIRNAYSFPNTDGTTGQVLTTNGAGVTSWANATVDTDNQTLTINNTTAGLSIADGNAVILSTIADAEADTKIQVEETADEDMIRFDLAGTEIYRFESKRIQISSSNTLIGDLAGSAITSGYNNTGIGSGALKAVTTGYSNAAMGTNALTKNTSGFRNTALGTGALESNLTGNNNTATGYQALLNNTADDNAAYGQEAMISNSTGTGNVSIGKSTLFSNTAGSNNTALGLYAGYFNTGSANVFLGHRAGQNETASNKLYIENSASTTPLIYGDFANDSVKIFGTFKIRNAYTLPNTDGTSGQVLTTNGAGVSSWTTIATIADADANTKIQVEENANENNIRFDVAGTEAMIVHSTGNVGIGSSSNSFKLEVGTSGDGTEARANAWNTFSDRRWKKDFAVISNALEKVEQINGYYYKWKNKPDTTTQVGVIAQEIESVLPEVVSTDKDGYKSVDYSKLTALLIEAIKEQQATIDNQEKRLEKQEASINDLNSKVDFLLQNVKQAK